MEYTVGIGEYIISANKEDIVRTFSLSTCVAMVVYDVNKKILAMAHIPLPNSLNMDEDEAYNSAKYADKAIFNVFADMYTKYNCKKDDFKISLFGGIDSKYNDNFKIGEKNIAMIKGILGKMNVKYDAVNTGGKVSRTLTAYTATGDVDVKTAPIIMNLYDI